MRYTAIILLALLCAACGSYTANIPSIKPYKMDIQQGNVVTSKMMMQLRPGMSKSQVRFIMGTPLLADSFHTDRWDYFYQMRKEGQVIEQRRVTLDFNGDALAKVHGDVIPAGTDATVPVEVDKSQAKPTAKAKEKEKGWLDKLKFWGDDDAANAQPKPAQQPKVETMPEPVAAPMPEKASAAESAAEPAPAEAPLPPLMDPSMQAKPEAVAPVEQAAPQEQPVKPAETKAAPAAQSAPKADSKPTAATESVPPAKSQAQPEAKAMTAPQPPKDLPPEDAPDFFEKMLEKIGF